MKLNRIHTPLFDFLEIPALIGRTYTIRYNNYHDYNPNFKNTSRISSFDCRIDRTNCSNYARVDVHLPGTCFDISGEGENDRYKT